MPAETTPIRTIVFVDAQNVYRTARDTFGWENRGESSRRGNFKALALGELLTREPERKLIQVRVYTGLPSQERDDQGYRAARKRFDTWTYEGHDRVVVKERNLRYRNNEEPKEKGVDVLLAIEMVRFAGTKLFDLAVVISADNDLVPALELVCDVLGSQAVESVSLGPPEPGCDAAPPLGVKVTDKRPQIRRRLIDRVTYEGIEDTRSYNPNAQHGGSWSVGGVAPGQSGRQLPRRRD
jgi:uncharacterized LabA/DUF88 family protein